VSEQKAPAQTGEAAIRCLVVPLDGAALLIPNALVSEVAPFHPPVPTAGPSWLLGHIEWRGLAVPLISIETLAGMAGGQPQRLSRAIVFNTLNGNPQMPFIAVLSRAIPRMQLVTAGTLPSNSETVPEGLLGRFEQDGETLLIPDLDRIEQWLHDGGIVVKRAELTIEKV